MKFTETNLHGVFVIDLEKKSDERGYFARTWDEKEFEARGLPTRVAECNTSFNVKSGTLRGMHYQTAPHGQAKLVRCTRGALYDVALDLRPESPSFKQWFGCELSADNGRMLFIPEGCAHGFQTLADSSEIMYQMSAPFFEEAARGIRYNDPAFNITWPLAPTAMKERDRMYPDWKP